MWNNRLECLSQEIFLDKSNVCRRSNLPALWAGHYKVIHSGKILSYQEILDLALNASLLQSEIYIKSNDITFVPDLKIIQVTPWVILSNYMYLYRTDLIVYRSNVVGTKGLAPKKIFRSIRNNTWTENSNSTNLNTKSPRAWQIFFAAVIKYKQF